MLLIIAAVMGNLVVMSTDRVNAQETKPMSYAEFKATRK